MRVQGEGLHWANVGLILGCAAAGAARPVEVLILSYAVLGPAHYLTQISWLSDRGFAAADPRDGWVLAAFAVPLVWAGLNPSSAWWGAAAAWGVAAAFVRGPGPKAAAAAAGTVLAAVLARKGLFFWAMLLPTLVHVYVFTALFLWTGARRERSPGAVAAGIAHLACGAYLLWSVPAAGAPLPPVLREPMMFFMPVAGSILFQFGRAGWPATSGVLSFMAFAYLYHYLNWFSKAGFLGWHRVGRGRALLLTAACAAMLGLYAWDFRVGFAAATGLGLAHVLLELPLDARTAAGLFSSRS